MIYQIKAFDALKNGDFGSAQKQFREAIKKSASYQAYNNLAMFYIENGIECKNGKVISGGSVAERLLRRALTFQENEKVLLNLAFLLSDKGCLNEALALFDKVYQQNGNTKLLYNIAVLHFRMGEYPKCEQICLEIKEEVHQANFLYALCTAITSPSKFDKFYNRKEFSLDESDDIDKFWMFYLSKRYDDLFLIEEKSGTSELFWLMDAYIQCGKATLGLQKIKEKYLTLDCSHDIYTWRCLCRMVTNADYRARLLSNSQKSPELINDACPYFGCPLHKTDW